MLKCRPRSALCRQTTATAACRTCTGFLAGIGGAFQSYTIGNILSAQLYDAACKSHPQIPNEIAVGQFSTLHDWLKDNLYRHGRKYRPTS